MITMYRVRFTTPNGVYVLDTTDAVKIGPWIAEMFGIFPYDIAFAHDPVSIEASTWRQS